MLFNDTYRTIDRTAEGIFRDRGSKFIGYAIPIQTEEEVKLHIQELKALHPKARHHCWAMRLSPDRSVFRINDDGEPSGTAGRPILNTLLSYDLTNILLVVVRYFGGTLLGVPGLINAYKNASIDALNQAQIIEKTINDFYTIYFDYLQMNDVMRLIKEEQIAVKSQEFGNECQMEISIRKMNLNHILNKLEKIQGIKISYRYTS